MRLALAAALSLAPAAHAQDVSCADLVALHQEAMKVAQTAQSAGVALLVMPYNVAMPGEAAEAVNGIGNDLSGSWQPYLDRFNEIAARSGCISLTE